MNAQVIPSGRQNVSAYLVVQDAAKALEFYRRALGATELYRLTMPDGRLGHAEFRLGNSVVMVSDEFPEYGCKSPSTLGGTPVSLHVYVEDVDAVFQQAIEAGAKVRAPVTDQFYGDRSGQLEDPFGHLWRIATHKRDVTPEEMQRWIMDNASASSSEKPREVT